MNLKFIFIAATVVTMLVAGSVLMAVIQTAMISINEQASEIAGAWARTFLSSGLLVILIGAILIIFRGKVPKGLSLCSV